MKRTFYLAAALLLCLALLFAPGLADEDAPAESTPVTTDADGNRTRAIRYKADFTYQERVPSSGPPYKTAYNATDAERWRLVVEDVKSRATKTDKYQIKRKLMKDRFGIDIQEV